MIAEDAIDGSFEMSAYARQPLQRRLERAEGAAAKIAGHHTKVVVEIPRQLDQVGHGRLADVDVHIADMQNDEVLEGGRKVREGDLVVGQAQARRVALASPIEPGELQAVPDHRMERVPVLDVKEAPPAREDVRLVVSFDAEALPGVEPAEPLLELLEEVGTHRFIACLAKARLRPADRASGLSAAASVAQHPVKTFGIGNGLLDDGCQHDDLETGQYTKSKNRVIQIDIKIENEQAEKEHGLKQSI